MNRADRPLRVLYVDASIGFGGACRSLATTLRAMPSVAPRLVTMQPRGLVRGWFGAVPASRFRRWVNYRNAWRARAAVERRLPPASGVAGKLLAALDLAAAGANALRLAWIARRHRADAIHANNGFVPLEALLAARLTGLPLVVHLRDFHRPAASRFAGDWSGAHLIAVSRAVAESLAAGPVPQSRISVVHDPVEVERIEAATARRDAVRRELGIAPGQVAVAIFGRVMEWKGQREFVLAAIEAMRSDASIRAVIVGDESDGSREYFDAVRALAGASPFAERFVFAGFRADVEACYAAMDVVVHASITPEPFGMVVPEAMAAGKPVIAADAGGPREVVDDGVDGILVPPGDVPALAEAILRLSRDPGLRERMGAAGSRKARERFRGETAAERVMDVYREVLAGVRQDAPVPARTEIRHA
jgi:glycosyltransferase involved in cell wall biosynthesis